MVSLPLIDSCDDCGVCCMNQCVPPFSLMDDCIETVPPDVPDRSLILAVLERIEHAAAPPATPCIWLDEETRSCRHYDDRPAVCRLFERGGEECRDVRRQFGIS